MAECLYDMEKVASSNLASPTRDPSFVNLEPLNQELQGRISYMEMTWKVCGKYMESRWKAVGIPSESSRKSRHKIR